MPQCKVENYLELRAGILVSVVVLIHLIGTMKRTRLRLRVHDVVTEKDTPQAKKIPKDYGDAETVESKVSSSSPELSEVAYLACLGNAECYIQGLMDGEALEIAEAEE